MSSFEVPVVAISDILVHPNADSLELAKIGGYISIVRKGQYTAGDKVVYIPEAAVLPEPILKQLSLWDEEKGKGKLTGSEGNRVKAIRLRGILSQGLLYPYLPGLDTIPEGTNVADRLGIIKYEPPIPIHFAGQISSVFSVETNLIPSFDIENWKKYPDIFEEGEEVIFTEKLHGTFTGITVLPVSLSFEEGFGKNKNILIYSKGQGAKGLVFKNNEENANLVYIRSTKKLIARLENVLTNQPIHYLGETIGKGIQDLDYAHPDPTFRLFAIATGYRGFLRWDDFNDIIEYTANIYKELTTVPVLYQGPFSVAVMEEFTKGKTVEGSSKHIREGIVIVPAKERYDDRIGRVILKSVSEDYLLRKNATEFN